MAVAAVGVLAGGAVFGTPSGGAAGAPPEQAVPVAECGPGSRPETGMQGRVSAADHAGGYSDLPITCNAELVAHHGTSGGYKVERYVDAAGHECAYYDSSLVAGIDVLEGGLGVFVLDMTDPCLLYTSPSPRDGLLSRMPSSA